MAKKNRWNSQRFVERIPEVQLESKIASYRKDLVQFEREQRIEKAQLYEVLFRNDRDLKNSFATRFSMNDIYAGRIALVGPKKVQQKMATENSPEYIHQLEVFKNHLRIRLKLSNGRFWHQQHQHHQQQQTEQQSDIQLAQHRPTPEEINAINVAKLLSGPYVDLLLCQGDVNAKQRRINSNNSLSRDDNKPTCDRSAPTNHVELNSNGRSRFTASEEVVSPSTKTLEKNVTVDDSAEFDQKSEPAVNAQLMSPHDAPTAETVDASDTDIEVPSVLDESQVQRQVSVSEELPRSKSKREQQLRSVESPIVLPPIIERKIGSTKASRVSTAKNNCDSNLKLPHIV